MNKDSKNLILNGYIRLGAVPLGLLAGFAAMLVTAEAGRQPSQAVEHTVQTSQHVVAIVPFRDGRLREGGEHVLGGAITADPTRPGWYFLVQPSGRLFRFSWTPSDELELEDLELRVPINSVDFARGVEPWVSKATFRVADILALRGDGFTTVYASHHYWKVGSDCFVVRVSSVDLPDAGRVKPSAWRTLFETSPCLPIKASRGTPFAGAQAGGNLESLPGERLLLTVGDHQFDGWYRQPNFVDDPSAHYGKIIAIDVTTGAASVFTSGHRNPQGLAVDARGRIWSTEHGPQGGDELNLLKEGSNYGYPRHTYGTEYGATVWPPATKAIDSSSGTLPVFAWVPSIGISDLVAVSDAAFENWQGDLIISSLVGRSLWRARLDGDRVAYVEPIRIGAPVRDMASGGSGELVLWTDEATLVRIRPLERLDKGSELFAAKCGGCHDDQEHRIGPTLVGMFDRRIASAAGYDYTNSLAGTGGYWTERRLNEFLSDPQAFAPGTNMTSNGVSEQDVRDRIIEYLEHYY